eukprot:GFUD01052216.1.p1 GENE.GFUD01052216.1~~GFUD01052216.1.p1  ORF type:complete len:281 (-),score=56.31 GFUD01052216.1:734-1513(-)
MVILGSPRLKRGNVNTDLLTHMQRTELDQSIEEQDSVPELPEIPQLQHLAKNRPKRPKKHASSKNVLKLAEGDSEDIKEGLDTFFAKSLTPNQTPIGSPLFEDMHSSRHGSLSSSSSQNMSPSIASRSREDLRMKVAQDKLKTKTNDKTPPGTSPFTARRSETEVFTSKRRSFFTGEPAPQIEEKSPDNGEGSSDDVIKRTKTGIGLGGDILAEMKVKQEKRASVIPKTSDIGNLDNRTENKEEENPFGGIKLRKTPKR